MNWTERIATDPRICHSRACIKGTRIPISVVLDNLAAGVSTTEILKSYPSLCADDVQAAIAYASEMNREPDQVNALPLTEQELIRIVEERFLDLDREESSGSQDHEKN